MSLHKQKQHFPCTFNPNRPKMDSVDVQLRRYGLWKVEVDNGWIIKKGGTPNQR